MKPSSPRLIAFYLPQFHPIPENDEWWGKGFTEWTYVAKAMPQFPGHYQPHLPADLGFYDLRLPEVREAQASLAREHGIFGFCYYHYWFNGRRLLGRPFDEVLKSGQPDFPFCLCWANEDWSRSWNGRDGDYLIRQKHSQDDDREHVRWLARAFRDDRYIKIDGRPLFLVYRAGMLPNARATTDIWRQEARRLGIDEPYLCRVESFGDELGDPAELGFDASVEFQPDWRNLGQAARPGIPSRLLRRLKLADLPLERHRVYEYADVIERMLEKEPAAYLRFPCVTPSWDNSPRRPRATILVGSSPELYERWLSEVLTKLGRERHEEPLVFINAWNEWGEGNHLEPCQRWGRSYLEATKRALTQSDRYFTDPVGESLAR